MKRNLPFPKLSWREVKNWPIVHLVDLDDSPGLLKFVRDRTVVYIGCETRSVSKFRRFVTPRGSWRNHAGGRLVHKNHKILRLGYALLDPALHDIEAIRDLLIKKYKPEFNFPDYRPQK